MGINLPNMVLVNRYKLDKYGGQWVIVVDKMTLQQVRICDILFETNTSENHEYMFLKNFVDLTMI